MNLIKAIQLIESLTNKKVVLESNETNVFFNLLSSNFMKLLFKEIQEKGLKNLGKFTLYDVYNFNPFEAEIDNKFFDYAKEVEIELKDGEYSGEFHRSKIVIQLPFENFLDEQGNITNLNISKLVHEAKGTFVHEARHAYDYFISDSKAFKNYYSYRENRLKIQNQKENYHELNYNIYSKYFNQDSEVSANIQALISSLTFIDLLDLLSYGEDVELIKFKDVIKELKQKNFFKNLNEENKKKVLKKVGSFYEFLKHNKDKYVQMLLKSI